MTFDPDTLDGVLELTGAAKNAVWRAIDSSPQLRLETAGASTLIVVCDDPDHELPAQAAGLGAAAAGRRWSLAAVKRSSGRTVLVFEDDVVRALRDATDLQSIPAGSTTVNEIATRLTRPHGVDVLLEPTSQTISRAFVVNGPVWGGLGDLATQAGRWRYSDGQRLVLASPEWLLLRPAAATVSNNDDSYGLIDYDLHSNKPLESAAAAHVGAVPAVGVVHQLNLPGPAAGAWLVGSYSANLGEDAGRVTWLRPAPAGGRTW